jgi:hypothetical protein
MPLSLSNEELKVVMDAAAPLHPVERDAFLRLVANALADCPPERIGVGLVARVTSELQRRFRGRGKFVA